MMTPYDEDPPQEALPRRATKELGLTHARAFEFGNNWLVSGFRDGTLRLYEMGSDGRWRELAVGREVTE